MFNRIKNILLTPKAEWQTIAGENRSHMTVLTTWVLILAAIPAVATCVGVIIGGGAISTAISTGVMNYIVKILAIYLCAWVISFLAPNFGATKNFNRAFELVAYAFTAEFVFSVFNIFPALSLIAFLGSIYSLVLLFMGLKPMMGVPDDKRTAYYIVALLAYIVLSLGLAMVGGLIITATAAIA